MAEQSNNHLKSGGSIPPSPLQLARQRFKDNPSALEALNRFEKNPEKCFQRHIREVRGEQEAHASMQSLDGATVALVDMAEAAAFIKKYEWLGDMGAGTMYAVGGFINGEMFGVECFGKVGRGPGEICHGQTSTETKFFADRTLYLMRGACAPWAHKKAASWLIRRSCSLLHQKENACIFFAYSDAEAGEIGIVYQRAHWKYLGVGKGRHYDYIKEGHPDSPLTSYKINHGRVKLAKKLGAPMTAGDFRPWLEKNGWTQVTQRPKGKYAWFEGTPEEISYMKQRCLIRLKLPAFVPYPERKASV